MLPTPGKIKKDMAWDKESMYAFWDVVCISFMSMVLVVNAITSNLQSEPLVFKWPFIIWPEHPTLAALFMLLYFILATAVMCYGTHLRGLLDKTKSALGKFYVHAGAVMTLAVLVDLVALLVIWAIVFVFNLFCNILYIIFNRIPCYIITRIQCIPEYLHDMKIRASVRKNMKQNACSRLIKEFDKIRN